jgi:hypothetical protein
MNMVLINHRLTVPNIDYRIIDNLIYWNGLPLLPLSKGSVYFEAISYFSHGPSDAPAGYPAVQTLAEKRMNFQCCGHFL